MFNEFHDFIYDCKIKKLSERTIKSYRNITTAFLKYLQQQGINKIEDIRKNDIQKYINSKIEQNLSDKYINTILKVLRAFFTYVTEEEYIDSNPIIKVKFLKQEKKIIESYNDEEINKLINAFDDVDYLSVRNKTIIALQLDTGIRCAETIDIQEKDVFEDRILIHGKGGKQRLVPLSPQIKKMIRKYMRSKQLYFEDKEVDDNLFLSRTGRTLTVEAIERIYKIAGENISRNIRVSPHTSRHTYAVKMLETNDIYTVSKLLGHSSVKITEVYLQSLSNEKLIDAGRINTPLQNLKSR